MDVRLQPARDEHSEARQRTLSRFEEVTGFRLPADARELLVNFGGQGLGARDLEVVAPAFRSQSYQLLSELQVLDLPADWVEDFTTFNWPEQLGPSLPSQSVLLRKIPYFKDQQRWATSLVPVLCARSGGDGIVCLDFLSSQDEPPVVFVAKGVWDEPSSPTWDGMWYLAPSLEELLAPSQVEEFDHQRDGFPVELDRKDRVPWPDEVAWNRGRDERLGREVQ